MGARLTDPTLLVVDDHVFFRDYIREVLTRSAYHVLVADSAAQTATVLKEHGPAIRLALVDLMLPDASGVDVVRLIKEVPATQHIIVLGATALLYEPERLLALRRAGAVGLVDKSTPPEEIVFRVNSLVRPVAREQRAARRALMSGLVHIAHGDADLTAFIFNISASGLFVRTARPLAVGEEIGLEFVIPELNHTVVTRAVVMRAVQPSSDRPAPVLLAGMGVAFVGLSPPDQAAIRDYVATHAAG